MYLWPVSGIFRDEIHPSFHTSNFSNPSCAPIIFNTFNTSNIFNRAVTGKLGGFQEKHLQEFAPESFVWTVYMSCSGTNILIRENFLLEIR